MSSADGSATILTIEGDAAGADEALASTGAAVESIGEMFDRFGQQAEMASAAVDQALASMSAAAEAASATMEAAATGTDALATSADTAAGSLGAASGAADSAAASISAEGDAAAAAAAKTDAAAGSMDGMAAGAKKLRMPLLLAGAAVVAIGGLSVKMAGDFQDSMTQLVTGAGESKSNLQMVSAGVLAISAQVGTSAKDTAAGLYMIESAGYHGAAGLAILKAAEEGAKVGGADMADVANGVTTALTDYHMSASQAAEVTNDLVATVASGKTHMQDLASSLSTILPTASAAGVSLKDATAAMATMTGEGTGAAQAATYLRQMILALEAPAAAGKKALESVGLSTDQVAASMKQSLPDTLRLITDAVGRKFPVGSAEYVAAIKNISGGSKQMQGMLELTGTHLATFGQNVAGITDAVKAGGKSITGWSEVQGDFNTQMAQFGVSVQNAMIAVGTALMPVIRDITNGLKPVLAWMATHAKVVAIGLGLIAAMLVGALVPVMNVMIGEALALNAALLPEIAIGAGIALAIAGLVAGFLWAYNNIGPFRAAIQGAGKAIGQLASDIGTRLKPILHNIGVAVGVLAALWRAHWSQISAVFTVVWNVIKGQIQIAWAIVSGIIKVGLDLLSGNWKGAWNDIKGVFKGVWDGIQTMMGSAAQNIELTVLRMVTGVLQVLSHVPGPIGDMASKGLAAVQKMEHGIETSMAKTKAATVEKTAAMQSESLMHFAVMQAQAAQHFDAMRKKLITEIQNTSDPVKKHALEMQLGVVSNAEKMHTDAAKHAEQMAAETTAHARTMAVGMVSQAQHMHDDTLGRIADMAERINARLLQLPGQALGALGQLGANLDHFFTGLETKALTWGENLIKGFIAGIGNMAGGVKNAVGNIAHNVAGFLGFHSPTKEGPGATADQWAPALMRMFAAGITANAGLVRAAALSAAHGVASGLAAGAARGLPATGPGAAGTGVLGFSGSAATAAATAGAPVLPGAGAAAAAGATAGGGLGAQGASLLQSLLGEQRQTNTLLAQIARNGGTSGGASGGAQAGSGGNGLTLNQPSFNGVADVGALYRALNQIGGIAAENALRGATAGLAL